MRSLNKNPDLYPKLVEIYKHFKNNEFYTFQLSDLGIILSKKEMSKLRVKSLIIGVGTQRVKGKTSMRNAWKLSGRAIDLLEKRNT